MSTVRALLEYGYEILTVAGCMGVRPIPVESVPDRTQHALETMWLPSESKVVNTALDRGGPTVNAVSISRAVAYGNWTFAVGSARLGDGVRKRPIAIVATHIGLPLPENVDLDDDAARDECSDSRAVGRTLLESEVLLEGGRIVKMCTVEPGHGELRQVDVGAYTDRMAFHVVSARVDEQCVSIYIFGDDNGRIDGILMLSIVKT